MAALQRSQLNKLCSTSETFEKAQSILRLANAKTRPGSGFVVKNPVAMPAVCAYLASEQLNTGEVSLQSAMSAACVTRPEFFDILNKVRAALRTEEGGAATHITYETLVDAYRVHPREDVIACMEDAAAALPNVSIVKERYGTNTFSCAVFYWVCQLMEETSVQERSLHQSYSIHPKTFKAVVTILDKQCDAIADQIKSYLLQKRSCAEASALVQPTHASKPTPTSPEKSPTKSAIRTRTAAAKVSTPAMTTPSKKRTVIFSHPSSNHDDIDPFAETPTKKRRVNTPSPTKSMTSNSPAKHSSPSSTAAFHAALTGSPMKLSVEQESESPATGASTPHRPRYVDTVTPTRSNSQLSPSRSHGQMASPTRPTTRRRFRPVFLEQQQWYARDPKVERMWAAAETLRDEMVALHGHPFRGLGQHGGAVVGAT